LVDESEQIIAHIKIFQDKLIVQGNENISTIFRKAHEEFSLEKEELERTLYNRAQYFLYFPNIFIIHMKSDINSIISNLRIVLPTSNSTSRKYYP